MSGETTATVDAPQGERRVTLREAFWYWLRLGFISFGGPAGQISIMHHDLVERRRWISERRFLHALNYCMLLPGPEAQQLAIYIGWLLHRTWGGIIAGTLFLLPSLVLLIVLSWVYLRWGDVPAVAGVLYGIKPAVVAIVLFAAYRIGSRALRNAPLWLIAGAAFLAMFAFGIPFPYIVGAAALIGFLGGRIAPALFALGGGHGAGGAKHYGPAVLDDDTPTPAHARFTWGRLTRILAVGIGLWVLVMTWLTLEFGWQGMLTQVGWFFTKAALLTFGGAYAVLPYVYQGGVEYYQWVTPHQMMDGLALGESTPGPLIMIVAIVGFIGAWTQAIFGPEQLFLAGAVAATVATFFTFLPSYLFILGGGPLVESTHGNLSFTAPLTGITAAVVGVIFNLGVFFAMHVLWPQGIGGPFDVFSLVVAVAAFVALYRYKVGIIPLIGVCGALGLGYSLALGL